MCWPGGKNSDGNGRILVRFDGSLHNLYVLQITVWECLALLERFRGRVGPCDIGRGPSEMGSWVLWWLRVCYWGYRSFMNSSMVRPASVIISLKVPFAISLWFGTVSLLWGGWLCLRMIWLPV